MYSHFTKNFKNQNVCHVFLICLKIIITRQIFHEDIYKLILKIEIPEANKKKSFINKISIKWNCHVFESILSGVFYKDDHSTTSPFLFFFCCWYTWSFSAGYALLNKTIFDSLRFRISICKCCHEKFVMKLNFQIH